MRLPRVSLKTFLSNARARLQQSTTPRSPVTFVVGNEAADLDSICSAIVYAYLRSCTSATTGSQQFSIPIANLKRNDLRLRQDLLKLLPFAGLEATDIITADDLPGVYDDQKAIPDGHTRWVLVDHNAMTGRLRSLYDTRVSGCIDHHQDEGIIPLATEPDPRIVTKCGSCTSLVIEHMCADWDATTGEASEDTVLWDAQLALLSLGPIMIDTSRLTPGNITTDVDIAQTKYLENKIRPCSQLMEHYDRDSFYTQLIDAKRDLGDLSMYDALRKDYKEWDEGDQKLGTSAFENPIEDIIARAEREGSLNDGPALASHMRHFAASRSMTLFAIMTAVYRKDFRTRQLVLFSDVPAGRETIKQFLADSLETLGLEEMHKYVDEHVFYGCWTQKNMAESRKGVAPRLRKAMRSVSANTP